MIIDVHNHIVAGEQLQTFQAGLINSAGFHRPGGGAVVRFTLPLTGTPPLVAPEGDTPEDHHPAASAH